jgi:peptidyl-prolyl cis-trans isomerase SDCCAG10
MSTQYASEPNPTASATLNTTVGPIQIALFANQAPLTCKNFLQHCKDNYYAGTIFHRVVPDFVIQGGDPTGTGSGGTSIYEYPEFEFDPEARDPTERVVLRDELHSRLRFNRRGLLGMAKSEDGTYGSQFFITLANTERELNGQCTIFGRLEGDSIYNVLKIADAERIEGTERPVYPIKVTSCEVGELGPLEGKLKDRKTTATNSEKSAPKKKKKAPKGGKTLLSFGDDEGDEEMPMRPAKPKFNTKLVADVPGAQPEASKQAEAPSQQRKRPRSPSPNRSPSTERKKRPKTPEPETQLPVRDPESPSRSPTPDAPAAKESKLSRTNAQIADLMASMRRDTKTGPKDTGRKKSALEAMIPETSIRGRKRPPPGTANGSSRNGTGPSNAAEREALQLFNAFKAKLEGAKPEPTPASNKSHADTHTQNQDEEEDEEAQLCDLHFIANCQSCQTWDNPAETADDKQDDGGWLSHELHFGKDTLGKDLQWKREHGAEADSLMVIDPREKEKEVVGRKKGFQRDRERERKRERVGDLEWDKGR